MNAPKSLENYRDRFPRSHACLIELGRQMPFLLKATLDPRFASIEDRLPVLEEILEQVSRMHASETDILPKMVESYALLSLEFLKLQKLLEKTGRYLHSTERAAYDEVYKSDKVFGGYYLEGLLLSQGLWPNHYRLAKAFESSFLSKLKDGGKVLEIGVGTGFHLRGMLTHIPNLDYTGVDLSPYAIKFCREFSEIERCEGARGKFIEASVTDGLPFEDGCFQNIVMGEVLEHLEKPEAALRELLRVTKDGGYFFMTTVVFAANIDHIYLFHTADEIREMCRKHGWKVVEDWVCPIYSQDTPEMRDRPMNVAILLRK